MENLFDFILLPLISVICGFIFQFLIGGILRSIIGQATGLDNAFSKLRMKLNQWKFNIWAYFLPLPLFHKLTEGSWHNNGIYILIIGLLYGLIFSLEVKHEERHA